MMKTWTIVTIAQNSSMPEARYKHSMGVIDDRICIFGGINANKRFSQVHIYEKGRWAMINPPGGRLF